MTKIPFHAYSTYLRDAYGERTYRIGVDAGFSCPNRGRDRRNGGCSFCDESGSRAAYIADFEAADLTGQIERSREALVRRYGASQFILYFQAFSSTYAPPRKLREIYDAGLAVMPFRELIVSTRPDCVDAEVAALLGSYRERLSDVWVELGLQSAHDETLRRIGRGHDVAAFDAALSHARAAGVKVAAHVIFGLPGEGPEDMQETVRFLAERRIDGIKIHNMHVVEGTPLAEEYRRGELEVPGPEAHLRSVAAAIELLPPETVVMRVTSDTARERLLAPREFWGKQEFRRRLVKHMQEHDMYQGGGNGQQWPSR
ncbi:MAG: TIGR01212 family radical SAM protein [Spirochaetaceae bacterium]